MSGARLKSGVCSCKRINKDRKTITKGKALGIYYEGLVDEKRIRKEIIPKLLEKEVKFPVAIYSYYSKYSPSKTGIDIINAKGGQRFKPKKPKSGSKSYDWVIDERLNIHSIEDFKII